MKSWLDSADIPQVSVKLKISRSLPQQIMLWSNMSCNNFDVVGDPGWPCKSSRQPGNLPRNSQMGLRREVQSSCSTLSTQGPCRVETIHSKRPGDPTYGGMSLTRSCGSPWLTKIISLVGGLEPWNFMISHILGMSSSQLTNIFQSGRYTTNQYQLRQGSQWVSGL